MYFMRKKEFCKIIDEVVYIEWILELEQSYRTKRFLGEMKEGKTEYKHTSIKYSYWKSAHQRVAPFVLNK